ncbi:MAG: hypothetical protein QG641_2281 [Candidatus Poribacteria bacterium]|nr:hypothetical protein [Candidatus Poribacteria bacterium]
MTKKRSIITTIIGCAFIIPNVYWIVLAESMDFSIHITMQSIFFNSVFSLVILIVLGAFLKRFHLTLNSQELIVIYVMINIASAIAGHGTMQVLIPLITHSFWYATPENDWANLFNTYIPKWLSVQNKIALKNFYEGFSSFYNIENFSVWVIPILAWSGFVFVFVFFTLNINIILRKKWTETDKLSYPMVQLPFNICEKPDFFKSRILWLGFSIPAFIDILNGLHYIYPPIPYLHVKLYNIGQFFTQKPWDAVGWLPISFYPFIVGLGFFIPVDLCFSLWFFFLFWKGQNIIWHLIGLQTYASGSSGHSGIVQQASGALIGICVVSLWGSRRYLKDIILHILGRRQIDESNELISYRSAFLGLIISGLFLLGFCYATGMSIWVVITFFALYFAIAIAITRIRAELGAPVHDVFYGNPDQFLTAALGTRVFGPQNLTMFSMFWFFCRGHYSDVMPFQLEGLKLASMVKLKSRQMLTPMIIAAIVGIFACFWAYMHLSYKMGMNGRIPNYHGWEAYGQLERWLIHPTTQDYRAILFIFTGFIASLFLTFMRTRFLWWPFHPAGYALSNAWGVTVTWFPLFISWILKVMILKYGGLRTHRKATPFFIGLILGDFIIGSIWSIIGTAFRIPTYAFWVY